MVQKRTKIIHVPAKKVDFVFLNCPFDDQYRLLFNAIIFVIYRCGFAPVSGLSENNAMDNRIDKIARMIQNSSFTIHDISRTQLDSKSKLPRFNMPFELGIWYGLKYFGKSAKRKINALILEENKYKYRKYISDISGIDVAFHNNKPAAAIDVVREWLNTASERKNVPAPSIIIKEYQLFGEMLPLLAFAKGFDHKKIGFNDYCKIVETFITYILMH